MEYKIGQFPHTIDFNSLLLKDGVFKGLSVTPGTGLNVNVSSGFAMINCNPYRKTSSTTVSLDAADSTNPRKDLIYLKDDGTITKATGTPHSAIPDGQTGIYTAKPRPPSLPSNSIPLAEVWVPANATSLTTDNIYDRRRMLPWSYALERFPLLDIHISKFTSGMGSESGDGSVSYGSYMTLETLESSSSSKTIYYSTPLKSFKTCKIEVTISLSSSTSQAIAIFSGSYSDWILNYGGFPGSVAYSHVGFVIDNNTLYGSLGKNTDYGTKFNLGTISADTQYILKAVYYKDNGAYYFVNNEYKGKITDSTYFPIDRDALPFLFLKTKEASAKRMNVFHISCKEVEI